jgi:hypothetical protein
LNSSSPTIRSSAAATYSNAFQSEPSTSSSGVTGLTNPPGMSSPISRRPGWLKVPNASAPPPWSTGVVNQRQKKSIAR